MVLSETEKNSLLFRPFGNLETLKLWSLQFVALLPSVFAFVMTVILLVASHDKLQPTWGRVM
ncbi:hypothetical protein CORC01_05875 [Colletotrichum orchidophilum]|uniref:Uncharacterized protein n=1 Tax=Colletotrichum orchidophilum TaxID=1209926 RepID=A0A1G4BBR3_9PEZI|nr:uncharacterized protein CORC01_05875 [Colletotrichum orchidophilum]OHE98786.1 hypothetical protein CORC01_05875 [Colletotrichum orchidophilum]